MRKSLFLLIPPVLVAATAPALAHTGHGAGGLEAGLLHPFNGLDHLLAMIGVGFWARQLGGRNLWLVPAAFVGAMAAGAGASLLGMPLPQIELGIAGSVIIIGLLVAFGTRLPSGLAAALVALLAFCHGHAHGSELPGATSALTYGIGFVIATAGLHGVGLGLGLAQARAALPSVARLAGGATALLGTALAAGF